MRSVSVIQPEIFKSIDNHMKKTTQLRRQTRTQQWKEKEIIKRRRGSRSSTHAQCAPYLLKAGVEGLDLVFVFLLALVGLITREFI